MRRRIAHDAKPDYAAKRLPPSLSATRHQCMHVIRHIPAHSRCCTQEMIQQGCTKDADESHQWFVSLIATTAASIATTAASIATTAVSIATTAVGWPAFLFRHGTIWGEARQASGIDQLMFQPSQHTHTHTHARARTHTHTHTHTRARVTSSSDNPSSLTASTQKDTSCSVLSNQRSSCSTHRCSSRSLPTPIPAENTLNAPLECCLSALVSRCACSAP